MSRLELKQTLKGKSNDGTKKARKQQSELLSVQPLPAEARIAASILEKSGVVFTMDNIVNLCWFHCMIGRSPTLSEQVVLFSVQRKMKPRKMKPPCSLNLPIYLVCCQTMLSTSVEECGEKGPKSTFWHG